ncbi:TonB-dependent receptor [Sphingomonas sp. AOB5]|uniref:TonB-dependent receptor n=1 Tax=Sphingomonas sp. AOB5 TaxID=3034017 RepID=UPI0023F71569|nr:TonB-dependent receptor [Sphingomonas sp. AOB5]MDF7774856.1 TonB-dependent receptor [Sphingomonas sp. AOB5]
MNKKFGLSSMALIAAMMPMAAFAQSSDAPAQDAQDGSGITEIVVTAERREASIQDTPIPITAVTGDSLRDRNVTDLIALQSSIPNVQFGQGNTNARLAIRGVGLDNGLPGAEARVAYYMDNVYVSRPGAVLGSLYDVDRVEVLRGPQGTLYGRNATAGSINVITAKPSETFNGYGQVTLGSYLYLGLEGAVGGPIADGISFRLSGSSIDQFHGYGKNIPTGSEVDDQHTHSARLQIRLEPSSAVSINLSTSLLSQRDGQGAFHFISTNPEANRLGRVHPGLALGGTFATNPRDDNFNISPSLERQLYDASATVDWKMGDKTRLTSISAYRYARITTRGDQDYLSVQMGDSRFYDQSRQYSQELRLSQDFSFGHFVIGGFYFREDISGAVETSPIEAASVGLPRRLVPGYAVGGQIKTEAMAGFGQITFDLSDTFSIDAGLRYNYETKEKFNEYSQFDLTRTWTPGIAIIPSVVIPYVKSSERKLTPKVTLNWKPSERTLIYLTYSEGYRSGGFNLGGVQPGFKPETLKDYEGGIKTTLLDGRLRMNLSAFYYDYANLQIRRVAGVTSFIENASNAEIYGVEGEITAVPVDNLELGFNFGLLNSRYIGYITAGLFTTTPQDLTGNQLSQAPAYTVDLRAQYRWELPKGSLTLRGEAHFVGRTYFDAFETSYFSQAPLQTGDAYLTYKSDHNWSATLFVRNITDELYYVAKQNNSPPLYAGTVIGIPGAPRTFGLKLTYNFGE